MHNLIFCKYLVSTEMIRRKGIENDLINDYLKYVRGTIQNFEKLKLYFEKKI